jgi:hypothetical protein
VSASISACRGVLLRSGASTGREHLARKTVDSKSMNSGTSVEETALILEHSDTSNVHKSSSFDPDRSRMCPLSLYETDLLLEERYGGNAVGNSVFTVLFQVYSLIAKWYNHHISTSYIFHVRRTIDI